MHIIPLDEFLIKYIENDWKGWNCFYSILSYYYQETEQNYRKFRQLIIRYIENNPEKHIFFVLDDNIIITSQNDELPINAKKIQNI